MTLLSALSAGAVHDLGWTLLHFLWQGLLLAAALELVLGLVRSAHARHNWALAVLVLMLLAPCATFLVLHGWGAAPPNGAALTVPVATGAAFDPIVTSPAPSPWMNWLVLLWLSGIAGLSLRALGGWVLVENLRRRDTAALPAELLARCRALQQQLAVTRPVRFLQSLRVSVPVVVGWLRPVILLPVSALAGLPPLQLDALILHELAHIRRHDAFINALLLAAETMLFYHPAIWWVSRRIRIEREHCCDDLAVARCGDAALYVEALASLEAGRLPPGMALAAGGRLKERAARLLGVPAQARRYSLGAITGLFAVTLVAASVALAQPGPARPAATRIDFTGNKAFSADTLKAQIQEGERQAPALTGSDNYGPDRLAYDRELLNHFYGNRGYADVRVTSPVAQPATGGLQVTFTIDEGKQYRIGQVSIDSKIAALLTPMLLFKSGDIYDQSRLKAALDSVSPQVRLRLQRDPGGKPIMNVAIDVEPDQKASSLERTYDKGMKPPALLPSGGSAAIGSAGAASPEAQVAFMQITDGKGGQPPINIQADNVRNDAQGRPTQFDGHATVQQGGITVRANSIRAEVAPGAPPSGGKLTRLIADGDVVLTQDGRMVHATHLEADIRDNRLAVSLSGGVKLELH